MEIARKGELDEKKKRGISSTTNARNVEQSRARIVE